MAYRFYRDVSRGRNTLVARLKRIPIAQACAISSMALTKDLRHRKMIYNSVKRFLCPQAEKLIKELKLLNAPIAKLDKATLS
jgi:hypothetical protein